MNDKILVDTNLWVYLYSKDSSSKYQKIRNLINDQFDSIIISTQVLGEIYNALTKKGFRTKNEAKEVIFEMTASFFLMDIETINVFKAIEINHHYQYSYWDSLIIATALSCNCHSLYSEDMHHNQVIDNNLHIINPFF